ncbi:MAG: sulfatase [Bacteroidia bacterium]|nr:sulfatase [Bacteroidia bacterium]
MKLKPILLACMFSSAIGPMKRAPEKPNILFIAIDDMNDWTTLFDKSNPIKTPNLERLASRGMFFSKAYCAAPASCPSRAAIMTGIYPHNSGVYDNNNAWAKLMPNAVTLSRYFMLNGYETYGAGKIFHHGITRADIPDKPAFEHLRPFVNDRPPAGGINLNGYTEKEKPLNNLAYDWGQYDGKMVDEEMIEWCEKVMDTPLQRPRFLAAGIFKPHLPFYADAETFKRYPFDETLLPQMPANDLDDVPEIARQMANREHFIIENVMKAEPGSPGSYIRMVQCYQAAADFADQMVGRIIKKLDESGRADNTIIVLWSDNGYHLGDKGSAVKFTLWEKSTHIPFIIVAPGVTKPGSRCDRPVSLLDIYPTLIELANLPKKDDLDGLSLVPLLKNPDTEWERPAIMTMGRGNHAIRTERWRYIHYSDGTEELYDHEKDPWEWTNLAAKPEYAKVIAQHKKWLPVYEKPSSPQSEKKIIRDGAYF